jgi:SPP1 gp7 family putative phage head morphogenesis protein
MKELRPVRPPIAVEREYHKKLKKLLKEMDRSLYWWLRAELRKNGIHDGVATSMADRLKQLSAYWKKRYLEEAPAIAKWFAEKMQGYTTTNLQRQMVKGKLKALGFDLKYSYHSQAERNVFQSIVRQNVNLITSIFEEHLTRVNGVVFRGIETGHDLARISEDLEKTFGVSERRAAMIARDQTNKATNNLTRERLKSYGLTKGKWMHTSSGRTYRDSHVEMDGEIYDLEDGCYDPDYEGYIQPGELVNCHCVCIPVIELDTGRDE